MNDDNMNGDTPEMPAHPRLEGGPSPHPLSPSSVEAQRPIPYGPHPYGGDGYGDGYGGGYGFLGAKNRFQEASRFLARIHRYELTLRKHWWILALAFCVSVGPAFYHVRTTPPSYQSTGKLWMSGKLDIKEGSLYLEELTSFIGTQVELLKSSTIYDRAMTNLLHDHPEWSILLTNSSFHALSPSDAERVPSRAGEGDTVHGTNARAQLVPAPPQTGAMSLLNLSPEERRPFNLTVTDFPKTAVIEVKAVGLYPEAVREFVNSIMEEYQLFRKGVRLQKSDVTLSSITEEVKQCEQDLRNQQERLQQFLGSNNVVLLQEQGSSAGAFAARLNKQLAALRTEMKLLELITPEQLAQAGTKSRLALDDEGPVGQGTANEVTTTLAGPQADFYRASQQIQLFKAKREELLEFLQPSHPKILKLDDEINEQEKIVEVFKRQSLAQMGSRREALALQISSLETSVTEWEKKALDASRRMANYERIRQDVQRTQALYEKLLGVIQQVDVNRTLDEENMRVVDAASKAKPVRRTLVFLGLGVAAGVFLGLGLLYFISLFDDRFASLSELASQIPEVVIGQVPQVRGTRRHGPIELIANDERHHAFSEAFRNIRSWLLFSSEKSKQPRMLLVTSSVPQEGKTTTSANLAVTLALAGSRVLLIDANLRRAGLHPLFNLPGEPGLAEILEQRASVKDTILETKTKNLWLLPAGAASLNPGELFLAPSCELFLARIRGQYDYILLDSAPVLATDDTANLAPKIDAVMFIVRADFTSARNAREALHQLQQRKAKVLGLVFNRSIATRSGGYYYRYNKYYYYGHYGKRRRGEKPKDPAPAVAPRA